MKDVYSSTLNEKKMIEGIQKSIGALPNGVIGCQTLSDIAIKFGVDCFPLTLQIYGQPTIIAKDLVTWSPKGPLTQFANSMLGSFTYPRATNPCSILINEGETICGYSCHAYNGYPESVMYRLKTGEIGVKRITYVSELPGNVKWAIGGLGLLDMYDPQAEGFIGAQADVLRKTNHNVLGFKNGMLFGVYYKNMTGQQIQDHVRNKMMFEKALLLDGGGLAAINGTENFAKINNSVKCGYAIQFI